MVDVRAVFRILVEMPKSVFTDKIERLLGQGTFGKVVEAYDKRTQNWVAVKIIRSIQKYRFVATLH